jgi:bacillolysin
MSTFPLSSYHHSGFRQAASDTLKGILKNQFGSRQDDVLEPKQKTYHDKKGGAHQSFRQKINGYIVEGGALVMHTNATGEVVAVNGDYVDGSSLSTIPSIRAKKALKIAIETYLKGKDYKITSHAYLTVVNEEGQACFAWAALVDYKGAHYKYKEVEQMFRVKVFADANTGRLCAAHPWTMSVADSPNQSGDRQLRNGTTKKEGLIDNKTARRLVAGTPSVLTYDCDEGTSCNRLISDSSSKIHTGDLAIDSAHNFAIDTYMYYYSHFGRDSIDDNGMVSKRNRDVPTPSSYPKPDPTNLIVVS